MAPGVRTFSRARWEEAAAAWTAGEYSEEWTPFRELAAKRGMIYPPAGSRWDSWEDDQPSQRAILIRAIRDTPALLTRTIMASSSWSEVVDHLFGAIAEWREEATARESEAARRRVEDTPGRREAPEVLGAILRRSAP